MAASCAALVRLVLSTKCVAPLVALPPTKASPPCHVPQLTPQAASPPVLASVAPLAATLRLTPDSPLPPLLPCGVVYPTTVPDRPVNRSEEHTSELQSR